MDVARRRFQVINAHVRQEQERQHEARCRDGEDLGTEQQGWIMRHNTASGATQGFVTEGYSVILPEHLRNGEWNVYRSAISPLKFLERYPDFPDIATLHDNFENSSKVYKDCKFLGARVRKENGEAGEYKWTTYGEVASARASIGSALVRRGIHKGASVGLYMINRPEWVVVENACSSFSYVSVPLYDTLGADAVQYIVNHAEISAIFCTLDKLEVLSSCLSDMPCVKLIGVVIDDSGAPVSLPKFSGVEIISLSDLEAEGAAHPHPFVLPSPEDMATICYTSGTTGTPKGVMLTHRNLIANSSGYCNDQDITSEDVHISYLPLAHIYERMNVITLTHFGSGLGFYQGDVLKLLDDMMVLKPTFFSSVPRLYNRIYDKVIATVKSSGGVKQWIFNAAYSAKLEAIKNGKTPSPIWDRLVFNKIRSSLGGRTRVLLSGASPISPEVLDFLRVVFGGVVCEGYGMTESACVISRVNSDDTTTGHVGSPIPACEIKLADVPEMDYTSRDLPHPRGEICVRGPIVFKGYYKDEVQTRETLDAEGWLHTGDVGMWLPGGKLKIIDRKKNIFKLAQGEYIAPEKIENVYLRSQFIAQIFVYGDSLNSSLVAIAAVDAEVLTQWAKSKGIRHYDDIEKLCQDKVVIAAALADMDEIARESQLRGFEIAKAVRLIPEQFSIENGLLTPSMKVKRPTAKQRFAKDIEDMYKEVAAKESQDHPIAKSSL